MKCLLFIYPHGSKYETNELAEVICDQILGYITSENVKFTYGPSYIVVHFTTNKDYLEELDDVLSMSQNYIGIKITYFLVPVNDGFSTNLSPKISRYLNDLDTDDNDNTKYEHETITNINLNDQLRSISQLVNNIEPELTIDEILDKISQFGMDSLTKQELNKLHNQSKK